MVGAALSFTLLIFLPVRAIRSLPNTYRATSTILIQASEVPRTLDKPEMDSVEDRMKYLSQAVLGLHLKRGIGRL